MSHECRINCIGFLLLSALLGFKFLLVHLLI